MNSSSIPHASTDPSTPHTPPPTTPSSGPLTPPGPPVPLRSGPATLPLLGLLLPPSTIALALSFLLPPRPAFLVITLAHILFNGTLYICLHRHRILAINVFHFSSLLFLGIAGLLLFTTTPTTNWLPLTSATTLLFGLTLTITVVYLLCRPSTDPAPLAPRPLLQRPPLTHELTAHVALIFLLLVTIALTYLQGDTSIPLNRVAYAAAILLFTLRLSSSQPTPRPTSFPSYLKALFAATALLLLYLYFFFTGAGRIVIASLVFTFLLLYQLRSTNPTYLPKLLALVLIIPALLLGGAHRMAPDSFLNPSHIDPVLGHGRGLDSVHAPLRTFQSLTELNQRNQLNRAPSRHGATFVNTLLVWIPRAFWPDKPNGFGRELTVLLRPHLLSTGQSMASLYAGEWLVNFGWPGLAVAALALPLFLILLDYRILPRISREPTSRRALTLALYATCIGGLPIYIWASSFSYFARISPALLTLVILRSFLPKASSSSRHRHTTHPVHTL